MQSSPWNPTFPCYSYLYTWNAVLLAAPPATDKRLDHSDTEREQRHGEDENPDRVSDKPVARIGEGVLDDREHCRNVGYGICDGCECDGHVFSTPELRLIWRYGTVRLR